ncbi:ABC transporter permease [Blautia hominis]|uniref:ABC transporter permease n=1 Tax=Blautia hominis TaxID=2025493 RepID=A0ABQ0BHX4_9FIRM
MRKVKNRKAVRRVADKTRKAAKSRNLIAVLAIALTALLFTSVFTIGGSIVEKQQEATMRQVGGSAHGGFKYLTQEEYDIVKKDKKLKEISYRIVVGEAVNDSLKKLRTEIGYYEDLDAKFSFCYPEEGRMPEAEDEIVTSDLVLKAMGIPCEVGKKVPVEFTVNDRKYEMTFTLSGFFKGDTISMSQIMLVSKKLADKVAPTPVVSAMENGIDASDYAGRIMADFNFSSSFDLTGKMEDLVKRCGFPEEAVAEGTNWAYLGMDLNIEDMLPIAALLLVILVSGYLIIYNIFYINVFHDIRHYGLLKTIGTTGKQLRKIVRRQAYMLCLYGIPLGLLLGGVTGKWILPIVMRNLVFSSTADTKVSLEFWIFAASALFSLLTVYISCIRPCRIASSVSPVEALRYTEGQDRIWSREKGKKTKKVNPWTMAAANMRRNKKKVVIVTTSLSLGLVLLNSVYGLVNGFDMDKFIASSTVSDLSVRDAGLDNPAVYDKPLEGVTGEFLDALSEQKGVEDVCNIYMNLINSPNFTEEERDAFYEKILDNPKARPYLEEYFGGEDFWKAVENKSFDNIDGKIFGVGRLAYEKTELTEGELDWEKFKTGKYVITSIFGYLGSGEDQMNYYEVGDKVTIRLDDGTSREYEVMAVGKLPYSCELQSYSVFEYNFVLPDREYLDFYGDRLPMRTLFNVEKDREKDVEKWLADYCENINSDLDFTSKSTVAAEFEADKNMYAIVGGLLALILAFIGILNFINTMVTSVLSRKQEFAMMEAVGMTGKQLRQMLGCEGVMYALLTGAASLILGGILDMTAVQSIGNSLFFYSWHFTVMPILACIPVLVVIVLVVPALCYKSMCRTSVTERMRKAE